MGALGITKTILATAVADAGTVVVGYPAGTTQDSLTGSTGGVVSINDGAGGTFDQGAGGFTVSFGASTITITNDSGITWPAQATLHASFGQTDINGNYNLTFPKQVQDAVADYETRINALENPTP